MLSDQQKLLVEKLGIAHEHSGLPPAPARVKALLIVSDKTELSFDDIREGLNLSKSATSNAINILLSLSKIEYVTFPGERKRYFRSRIKNWQEDVTKSMEGIGYLSTILNEVLQQRPDSSKDFNEKLSELIEFINYIRSEILEVVKKWEQRKKN